MAEIIYDTNMWFDVEEDLEHVSIGVETQCGNYVTFRVSKKKPYSNHLKQLVEALSSGNGKTGSDSK